MLPLRLTLYPLKPEQRALALQRIPFLLSFLIYVAAARRRETAVRNAEVWVGVTSRLCWVESSAVRVSARQTRRSKRCDVQLVLEGVWRQVY